MRRFLQVPKLFGRTYSLEIVPRGSTEKIVVAGLRVTFEITKSVLSHPNLCKLVIYNPNETTLAALQKKFTRITFNAGYEGLTGLLFKGEIRNAYQGKTSTDRTITLYAADGERDWQNSRFNKTYSENVNTKQIITDVIESFKGLTQGLIEGLPDKKDKVMGETLSGSSKDIMDRFAKEYDFNWSIQNEQITISKTDEPLSNTQAILITPTTGMIGSPTVTEIGADVTSLLNPKLLPDRLFKIESVNGDVQLGNLYFREIKRTTAEGIYKIQEVTFKGDSWDGDWLATIKGRSLNVRPS